jgi:hypothetical protein
MICRHFLVKKEDIAFCAPAAFPPPVEDEEGCVDFLGGGAALGLKIDGVGADGFLGDDSSSVTSSVIISVTIYPLSSRKVCSLQ